MILGIGTDMVEIARMAALLARHPHGPARHILAPGELDDWRTAEDPARFLAKRFAVKEAFAKALGTGLRAPAVLPAIALEHDALGKPRLVLADALVDYLRVRGVTRHHVSLSDERLYALAFVVLEGADAASPLETTS